MSYIFVPLTEEQEALVEPVMEAARNAEKPGICFAQVFGDHLAVGFMSHAAAEAFYKAIGKDPPNGTCASAFGRSDEVLAPEEAVERLKRGGVGAMETTPVGSLISEPKP